MTSPPRVLVVGHDQRLRHLLARGLRSAGFDVVAAAADRDGLAFDTDPAPDAVVLDVPGTDGGDVRSALRTRGVTAPVIVLGPRRPSAHRALGHDYLPKPFPFPVLVARLQAALSRPQPPATHPLHLDPVNRILCWQDRRVRLSPIEYRLVARMLTTPDAVVRRRELRDAGWPAGGIVTDNTLDQYMTKLRRKLRALGAPLVLRSSRGVGYRLLPDEPDALVKINEA